MFVAEKIRDCSSGLVGINQPFDSSYAIFEDDLLVSRYGQFIDSVSLFKAEYFVDVVCPKESDNEQKNILMRRLFADAFVSVCNRVFSEGSMYDRQVQFPYAQNLVNIETNLTHGFVGQRLRVSNLKNAAFRFNRVFVNVYGVGELTLKLYNTNKQTPVQTKVIEINSGQKSYNVLLNWVCNNQDFYKGEWYVGYTFDGSITPFKRDYENGGVGMQVKELFWEEIQVPNHTSNNLFDLDKVQGGGFNSGLNFDITTYEDLTDYIVSNDFLFAEAVKLEAAIQVFQRTISSNRSNINERYGRDIKSVLLATLKGLKGQGINEVGLENMLVSEITRIRAEIEKLKKDAGTSRQIMVGTLS